MSIGIGGAICLNEYTKNKKFVSIISFTTEVLAGIPSIIYGLFGMLFFGSVCHLGFSILTGSLTLAIMILPIISRNTQTALECVPKSYREAALGIGATKWYMIRTVLFGAIPSILTESFLQWDVLLLNPLPYYLRQAQLLFYLLIFLNIC